MTDERDPSGRPYPPRVGESDNGSGGYGEGTHDAGPREPQPRPGFGEQDPGLHRGPRRSRYGRRRNPNEGPGEGGGYQQDRPPRAADPSGEDVENYLPSFIAGPASGPMNGGQDHGNPQSANHGQPSHNPSHQSGGQPHHQSYQGHQPSPQSHQPHQGHQGGNPGMNQGAQPNHGGGHQPMQHADHQGGQHIAHQPPSPPMPEEPSPETQAAAAAFAEWEDSNPKLRGLLICNPTVRRGEPIVRGTRIPARILAAIAKMGSSVEEMLQDYPALTKEGLDAALAFASATPRPPR